jgi:hypothetical protein
VLERSRIWGEIKIICKNTKKTQATYIARVKENGERNSLLRTIIPVEMYRRGDAEVIGCFVYFGKFFNVKFIHLIDIVTMRLLINKNLPRY